MIPLSRKYAKIAILCILANGLAWWLINTFSRFALDTCGDMVEAYAWGISWTWGYDKHPPMSGWMAAGWFSLWPTTDWAFFLLSSVNLAAAFSLLFLAMRPHLGAREALSAVALTSMISLFGPDCGFRFNANAAVLPWLAGFAWALSGAVQSIGDEGRRRHPAYACYLWLVSAGLFAAAAFLAKYHAAVVLCVVFLSLHAVRVSLRQALSDGLVIGVTALLLVSPHLAWGFKHDWPTLAYVIENHQTASAIECVQYGAQSLCEFFGFLAFPILVWLVARTWAKKKQAQYPASTSAAARLRMPNRNPSYPATITLILCLALTFASALVGGLNLEPKWFTPAGLFLGWALLELTSAKLRRRLVMPILCAAVSQWCLGLAYAGYQCYCHSVTGPDKVALRPLIAQDAGCRFLAAYGQPLRYVAGTVPLAFATSFYAPSHPLAIVKTNFARSVWIDRASVDAHGLVVLCDEEDTDASRKAEAVLGLADQKITLSYKNGTQIDLLLYGPLRYAKRRRKMS